MKTITNYINESIIQESIKDKIQEKINKLLSFVKPENNFYIGVSADYFSGNIDSGSSISTSEVSNTLCAPIYDMIKNEAKDFIVNTDEYSENNSKKCSYCVINCSEEEAINIYEKAVDKFVKEASKEVGIDKIKQNEYETKKPKGLQHYVNAEYYVDEKDGARAYFYPGIHLWRPKSKCKEEIKLTQNIKWKWR